MGPHCVVTINWLFEVALQRLQMFAIAWSDVKDAALGTLTCSSKPFNCLKIWQDKKKKQWQDDMIASCLKKEANTEVPKSCILPFGQQKPPMLAAQRPEMTFSHKPKTYTLGSLARAVCISVNVMQ